MSSDVSQAVKYLDSKAAPSYPAMFRRRVIECPDRIAYYVPPKIDGESWQEITWFQAQKQVDRLSAGLISLGIRKEERVAIISSTRIEWVFADLAIACAGAATTTVYPNTHNDEEVHILTDSTTKIAIVENSAQLEKITKHENLVDQIEHIVLIDDDRQDKSEDFVLTWQQLLDAGDQLLKEDPSCVDRAIETIKPSDLSTLIYTSGTTGTPKGVELVNRNWTHEGEALQHMVSHLVTHEDNLYLWLPLSHVFGRDLIALHIAVGMRCSVDGRVNHIMSGMQQVHPTIMVGVPRIFEKIRSAVITIYPAKSLKGHISRWAFATGRDALKIRMAGKKLSLWMRFKYSLADKLVFSKLREKMGGKMRFMISGSAKLSRQVQEWFYWAGLPLIEGYGATETSAVAFLNLPDEPVLGSIGKAVPGLDVKFGEENEILLRGPIIARGYHNMPEETAEVFKDGWYHTGDIGRMDEDGNMFITDRKKDLFKTSNGKFAAPQKIENAIMANTPYVNQAIAIGEGRKFCSAIVTLDRPALELWAKRRGHENLSYAELTQLPEIKKSIDRFIRKANSYLENWEQVKRYTILDHELTQENGDLTPSLKVRRNKVYEKYADQIDAMYEEASRSDLTV